MNEATRVDWSVARQTVQGDEKLLRELIRIFLDELPRMMQSMRTAVEKNEARSLQRAAHTLKGALGHFGAQDAYRLALQLEDKGRDGDLDGVPQSLKSLELAMAKLTPVLLDYVGGSSRDCGE